MASDPNLRRRAEAARERARDLQESAAALHAQARQAIKVSLRLREGEADDIGEDIVRLLEQVDELDLSPAFRDVLLAVDDALAGA